MITHPIIGETPKGAIPVTAITSDRSSRVGRGRKLAALLAGGLVLGVGTMATLASWNDSEFASATFTAGRFNLEGSTDGGATYTEHSTAEAAGVIDFAVPVNNLSPGEIIDGSFPVRLAAGTTHDATLRATKGAATGEFKGIAVLLWQSVSNDCGAVYDPDYLLSFMMDGVAYNGIRPTLTKGATAEEAGAPVHLCYQLITGDDLPQGQTGTFTWRLEATSAAQ